MLINIVIYLFFCVNNDGQVSNVRQYSSSYSMLVLYLVHNKDTWLQKAQSTYIKVSIIDTKLVVSFPTVCSTVKLLSILLGSSSEFSVFNFSCRKDYL